MNKIELVLDDEDFADVNNAIEDRARAGIMPDDDGSNAAGACIAEICRGWAEMLTVPPPRDASSEGEEWKQ